MKLKRKGHTKRKMEDLYLAAAEKSFILKLHFKYHSGSYKFCKDHMSCRVNFLYQFLREYSQKKSTIFLLEQSRDLHFQQKFQRNNLIME